MRKVAAFLPCLRSTRTLAGARANMHFATRMELVRPVPERSEEHTSELQSQSNLVCRLLLENKKIAFLLSLPCLLSTKRANYGARSKSAAMGKLFIRRVSYRAEIILL